jgi:hypothetical protein
MTAAATFTHAESVVWNGHIAGKICSPKNCGTFGLQDVHMQVSYYVRVTNASTGEVFSSGSTVPQGTRVKYEFLPHEYTHIYWFTSGYNNDSPYGDWIVGAGKPAGNICIPKNDTEFSAKNRALKAHVVFSVAPPAKSITGLSADCTTDSDGISKLCTLDEPGAATVQFNFANTPGKFYGGGGIFTLVSTTFVTVLTENSCTNPIELERAEIKYILGPAITGTSPLTIDVSFQTIPFTLTVTEPKEPNDRPEAHAPATPTLTSGGACVVGTPHAINFVSTDPDGDNIRYGIDWDANGSIDQWVPPSGYVSSGTTQTASRTYAIAGEKTVKVLAQDEGGLSSSWATVSFDCAGSATTGLEGNGSGSGAGDGGSYLPPTADLDLRVIPSLVRTGDTTTVNWSAENVESCTVSAPNADSWSGTQSPIGGETSSPITIQTVYTLSCIDLDGLTQTKQATVRILPVFQEI